jgi:hypothetical protein
MVEMVMLGPQHPTTMIIKSLMDLDFVTSQLVVAPEPEFVVCSLWMGDSCFPGMLMSPFRHPNEQSPFRQTGRWTCIP